MSSKVVTCVFCQRRCVDFLIEQGKHKYIVEPLSDGQVISIINMVAVTASFLEEGHIEELQSVILPLLAYIAERKSDYTLDLPACIESATKSTVLTSLVQKLFASEIVEVVSMATQ